MLFIILIFKFFVELITLSSFLVFIKINLKEMTEYMEITNKIPARIIELEISIKLLEYLKRKSVINDGMYNFCIHKLMNKLTLEKK